MCLVEDYSNFTRNTELNDLRKIISERKSIVFGVLFVSGAAFKVSNILENWWSMKYKYFSQVI